MFDCSSTPPFDQSLTKRPSHIGQAKECDADRYADPDSGHYVDPDSGHFVDPDSGRVDPELCHVDPDSVESDHRDAEGAYSLDQTPSLPGALIERESRAEACNARESHASDSRLEATSNPVRRSRPKPRMPVGSLLMLAVMLGLLFAGSSISALASAAANASRSLPRGDSSVSSWPFTSLRLAAPADHAQEGQSQDDQAQDGEMTDEERLKKYRGRLPNYFGKVINNEQRDQIYGIQAKFNEQIATLEAQIEKLNADRDQQVESVLTPEQLAEVNKMRDEAKSRRQAREAAKKSGDGAGTDSGN